jgi:hypothetical protein
LLLFTNTPELLQPHKEGSEPTSHSEQHENQSSTPKSTKHQPINQITNLSPNFTKGQVKLISYSPTIIQITKHTMNSNQEYKTTNATDVKKKKRENCMCYPHPTTL